jgi:transposase-like protein
MGDEKRRARRIRTTPEERARTVARFHASGLSRAAFARRHGLVLSTFIRWLAESRSVPKRATPVLWREIPLGATMGSAWAVEVENGQGVKVRFREPPAASELVRLLRDLPC